MRIGMNVLLVFCLGVLVFGLEPKTTPDEEAITDLFLHVVESWGQEPNVLIPSSLFAENLTVVDPRGHTLSGLARVRQAYGQLLSQGRVQGSQLTLELEEIGFRPGEAASVDGTWELSWPAAQGKIPKLRGRFSVDLQATAQHWKFQAARVTRSR